MLDEWIQKHNDLYVKSEELAEQMDEIGEKIIEELSSMRKDERNIYLRKLKDTRLIIHLASAILRNKENEDEY